MKKITKADLNRVKKELKKAQQDGINPKRITFLQATVNRYTAILNK